MSDLTITLPDGSTRTLPKGATGVDLAADIGPGLAKAAIIANVNGDSRDLDRPLPDGATVAIVTADSDEGLHTLRHSTAHVLAHRAAELERGGEAGFRAADFLSAGGGGEGERSRWCPPPPPRFFFREYLLGPVRLDLFVVLLGPERRDLFIDLFLRTL